VAIIKKPKYGVSLGNSFAQARIGYHFKVDEMLKDERSLAILAARNGKVYEVHKHPAFLASIEVEVEPNLDEWQESFQFRLPKMPLSLLNTIHYLFRKQYPNEALLFIYWDIKEKAYYLVNPEQKTNEREVDYGMQPIQRKNDDVLVAHIHSHGGHKAGFSEIDNLDEVATGLYIVIGEVNRPFYDVLSLQDNLVRARVSINGYHKEIDPAKIFERVS